MENNENGVQGQPACAACRHQRKSCAQDCVLRQHFPYARVKEFASVQKIFGIANARRMINSVGTREERDEVAESIYWEAKAWADDPIHGPYGQFKRLEQQLEEQREHCNKHHATQAVAPENNRQYEPQVAESNGTPTMDTNMNGDIISLAMGSYVNGYSTSSQPIPETEGELVPNSYVVAMGGSFGQIGMFETVSLGDWAQHKYIDQTMPFIDPFSDFQGLNRPISTSHPSGTWDGQWSGGQVNGYSEQLHASFYTLPTSGTAGSADFNVNNTGNLDSTEIHQLNSMNPQLTNTTFLDQFRGGN